MPWTPPATGVKRTPTNFETPLKAFVDGVESTANTAVTTANAAQAKANAAYVKQPGGITGADLAPTAAVQNDGTVLRAVALTQAQYDALPSKVGTTLYVIT